MNKIEILAPAGSMESLYAAINKGADAVYLGGNKFSARAYASNFDNENMKKAIDYAHSYGVKIYVTLNTILKENEIDEAVRYVGYLYEIGADALIIQDLGLFKRIKEEYNDLEIHASTQMTIHNGEAAIYFKEKGFHRVVLSREMSLDEIKHISKELMIETEMFVHGAICISYSGQCLMSSIIGGRSGNRGRCAQPCRMEYTLQGEKSGEQRGYLLSPKDMCTIEDVKDIIDTGTFSLKIEGRMKRPEYVAGVVDNYRKAVDKVILKKKYNEQEGKGQLLQLFNRSGFTNAYLKSNTGKDMMSFNSPKNTGVPLGQVEKNGEIKLKADIALGDGIRHADKGFTVSKILINGKEQSNAKRGDIVKIFPINYKNGEQLYKSLNKELFDELEDYIKPYAKKISLNASVKFVVGSPIELNIKYKGKSIFDVLDMSVSEGVEFFQNIPSISRHLVTLEEVGLGYIKIGQPATTLSGGEAQRVKLSTELAKRPTGRTIYILDEPTTGLHTADVHRLIDVLQRLTDAGNTVLVIEHNLNVIKVADYLIDLGKEGGTAGGTLVVSGTPEEVAACADSYTGNYLKAYL